MTINKLLSAAALKKSVIGAPALGCGHRSQPAAWIVHQPFVRVMEYLPKLRIYKPKTK
jgi:hypothetical protein